MRIIALLVAISAALTDQEVLDLIAEKIKANGKPDCVPPNIAAGKSSGSNCGTFTAEIKNGRATNLFALCSNNICELIFAVVQLNNVPLTEIPTEIGYLAAATFLQRFGCLGGDANVQNI